ncbi:hypothetical protein OC844_007415 [Tilletia horrida]|nr:hypothetical protein OC844_007415 [Tilletia horrida]
MTKLRPHLGPLATSERDRILFAAHLDAARTFIGSDAHYLPRSTNMRLPDGKNLATSIRPSLPWPTPPLFGNITAAAAAAAAGPSSRPWAPSSATAAAEGTTTVADCNDPNHHHHGGYANDDGDDGDGDEDELDLVECTCGAATANQRLAELAAARAAATAAAAAAADADGDATAAAAAAVDAEADGDLLASSRSTSLVRSIGLDDTSTIASDIAEATEVGTAIALHSNNDDASSITGGGSSDGGFTTAGDFGAGPPVSPSTTVHSTKSPYSGPTKALPAVTPGHAPLPSAAIGSASSSSSSAKNPTRGRSLKQGTRTAGGGATHRMTPASAAALPCDTSSRPSQLHLNDNTPLPWEEDDVDEDEHPPTPLRPYEAPVTTHKTLGSSTAFLAAIPCLFVNDIQSVLPFYKTILGFTVVGKPDISYAKLRRGDVTIYLRIPPLLPPGSEAPNPGRPGHRNIRRDLSGICEPLRENVHPSSIWVTVASVDAFFHECLGRVATSEAQWDSALQLCAMESYFPDVDEDRRRGRMGKILGRVENKPWGTREFSVQDADANRITFQQEIRR